MAPAYIPTSKRSLSKSQLFAAKIRMPESIHLFLGTISFMSEQKKAQQERKQIG